MLASDERADYVRWRQQWSYCWWCGWKLGTPWPYTGWLPRLEANHVFGGGKRDATLYATWASIMLCQWCHQERWSRTKGRARVLLGAILKSRHDPKHFDLTAMNAMGSWQEIAADELNGDVL